MRTKGIDALQLGMLGVLLVGLPLAAVAQKPTREELVRADRQKVESEGFWIYNDLERAFQVARDTGKPILVALRCIPCEECVKLDDELVDTHPEIRPLLERFVCVRVVSTNGLDLDTFQYDTDQSFAMFMLNADKTIYGRFGTRSHRTDWIGDVSLTGMARALDGALQLHAAYPADKSQLAGKRGQPLEFSSPEEYPSLREQYDDRLNYSGDVVKSCIHCHQIGDARREYYWQRSEPIPDALLHPYPHPKSIGLILDPEYKARVKRVEPGSAADRAGLAAGDDVLTMQGQPLLSMADVQWVLHNVPAAGGQVSLGVARGDQSIQTTLRLEDGWRRADDTSWRVATWGMRRIATGGMRLAAMDPEAEPPNAGMALHVLSVGQYGPHAAAKNAGFQKDDIIIEFDGRDDLRSESDLFDYVNQHHKPGDQVAVKVLRAGRTKQLTLPIQE